MFILIYLTEIKPPINQLFVLNEKCLHWKAEKYEEDTEVYKVTGEIIISSLQLHQWRVTHAPFNVTIPGDIHRIQRLPEVLS